MSSTKSAVQTMGECHELANASVSDAEKATLSFADITVAIKNISDMATQIATEAEQQTSVTEEISRNTTSINEVSAVFFQEAEKGIKEASALQGQAQQMGVLVNHFQLD